MKPRSYILLGGVALLGFLFGAQSVRADFAYPSAVGQTYVGNLFDLGTILGAEGSTGLPKNASSAQDELIGTFNQTSIELGGNGTNLIPSGTNLLGMYGNLTPIAEYHVSTGLVTPIVGLGPIVFNQGDILYFGNAGRNDLTGGPAGSGGYFLVTDNKTGASLNTLGNGANESPQNLTLQPTGSTFSVSNTGALTGNTDNYNNGSGNVVDTNHIILAGTFESFGTITGLTPPSTFGYSTLPGTGAPAGTVYAEVGTSGTGGPGTTATGAVGFGYLNIVGGSSASSFNNNTIFTAANTTGVAAHGGPAGMELTINSTFNSNFLGGTPPSPYTQFQSGSNDPNQYVGVPEPASIVMFAIGLACAGGAFARRRLGRKSQLV